MKVKITKDFSIAFDGVNTVKFKAGDVVEVEGYELERLQHYKAAEPFEVTKKKEEKPQAQSKAKKPNAKSE